MIVSEGGGGFPAIPQGSPGGVRAAARSLDHAADHLDGVVSALQGAGGALEADWEGYAAGCYRVQSQELVTAARTGGSCFRGCARAVEAYAGALESVQDRLRRLREQWQQAKAREADAATRIAGLTGALAAAHGHEATRLSSEIQSLGTVQSTAGTDAAHYVRLAQQALEHFRGEAHRHAAVLSGQRLPSAPHLGPGGDPFGAGVGPATTPGLTTPGFGIPAGGLSSADGTLRVGDPWNSPIPGFGMYMDSITPEAVPTDDVTTAVTFLAGGVGAVGVKALGMAAREVVTGTAERLGIGAAGREAVERAGQAGFDAAYQEARAAGLGKAARFRAATQAREDAVGKELAAISARRGGYAKIATQILQRTGALHLPGGTEGVDDLVARLVEHSTAYRAYVRTQLMSARDAFARVPTPGAQAAARALTRVLARSGR